MPHQTQNDPVGKLFYHEENSKHEVDVVVLGLIFDKENPGVITELTLLSSAVMPSGESRVMLQRFTSDTKPVTVELDDETLHLLTRESSILLEKRIRTSRVRGQR